jgi:uncharacterized membrane protein YphA (DoxX/SURF4 family)
MSRPFPTSRRFRPTVSDFTIAGIPVTEHRGKHRVPERQPWRALIAAVVGVLGLAVLILAAVQAQFAAVVAAGVLVVAAAWAAVSAMRGDRATTP